MTKSKIKLRFILWFISMSLSTMGLLLLIGLLLKTLLYEGVETFLLFMVFLLSLIVMVVLIIFKDFKYIVIDREAQTIRWRSIYYPLGKTVRLQDFKGYIKSVEYGRYEDYRTVHLVDKSSRTSFKINGLFYENFDEIYEAIELNEIKKYHFGFWKYLKLICTGRIQIE